MAETITDENIIHILSEQVDEALHNSDSRVRNAAERVVEREVMLGISSSDGDRHAVPVAEIEEREDAIVLMGDLQIITSELVGQQLDDGIQPGYGGIR